MTPVILISKVSKIYASGHDALKSLNLDVRHGEIFGLSSSNGAGKTTLISIILIGRSDRI
jgi:ABC-2 type transport system ATP-binding protein